jgi:hypothetical protein
MSTSKLIQGLQKQNDSIFSSLVAKNIQFDRIVIMEETDEQEHLRLLNEENAKLKDIIKVTKQVQQPKEVKEPKEVKQPPSNNTKESKSKPKEKKEENRDEEDMDQDEVYDEPVKKFDTITNMEDMKRAFFGGDYKVFEEQLNSHPFKLYNVAYKYNSDKDGAPDFSAKNLLKGFVRNFDDYRKYFMICFRCWKSQDKNEYKYDSFWISNTNEPIQNIIGSMWDDFEFEATTGLDNFVSQIKKLPETDEPVYIDGFTCIGEAYVH